MYLGQDLPFMDIQRVVNDYKPDGLFTSFISPITVDKLNHYLSSLATNFANLDVIITGLQLKEQQPTIPKKLKIVSSISDFKTYLTKLK